MAGTLPATPNQNRRLRLLEAAVVDNREGCPMLLTAGIVDEAPAGTFAGFAVEAVEPADPDSVQLYADPVFGPGGGVRGGPFALDVHPGASDGSREQVLVAIAAPGSTFIMDLTNAGVHEPPLIGDVGDVFDLIADPDNGAFSVDATTRGIGTTVIGVNIVTDNRSQSVVPGTIARTRLEVAAITPQLPG